MLALEQTRPPHQKISNGFYNYLNKEEITAEAQRAQRASRELIHCLKMQTEYQLSIINYQLSIINSQFSILNSQLSEWLLSRNADSTRIIGLRIGDFM
jgi:hypothetical protein